MKKTVLSIMAHPDDAEFVCTGTLSLLKDLGWNVHIATMTPGDCGSNKYSRAEISKIRKAEAAAGTKVIGATYHCLECEDVYIMYDKPTLAKVISLIREVRPSIVFTHSPNDYFMDHENTSTLARTGCFACGIPNVECQCMQPCDDVPFLYYADVLGGDDIFGKPVEPGMHVDISGKIEIKEQMLCCHESQRNWLLEHHGIDEYVISMKKMAEKRGDEAGWEYAEAFRQHLGHAYPSNNILKEIMGEKVK